MSGAEILIVDDERGIRQSLTAYLRGRGYVTGSVASGEAAVASVQAHTPDLVLLDLLMPGIGGVEACRRIRASSSVPIVVLSALDEEEDKVEALRVGADDYITKPFGPEELIARIEVGLRHGAGFMSGQSATLRCGALTIDLSRRLVTLDDLEIRLTATEYALLRCLAVHAAQPVSHETLLAAAFGSAHTGDLQQLRFGIYQLRRKLGDDPLRPRYIVTEFGVGYWLRVDQGI
jgi:two-component system KDP operon response regulator KdpE